MSSSSGEVRKNKNGFSSMAAWSSCLVVVLDGSLVRWVRVGGQESRRVTDGKDIFGMEGFECGDDGMRI